jgi:hypothetical protein
MTILLESFQVPFIPELFRVNSLIRVIRGSFCCSPCLRVSVVRFWLRLAALCFKGVGFDLAKS